MLGRLHLPTFMKCVILLSCHSNTDWVRRVYRDGGWSGECEMGWGVGGGGGLDVTTLLFLSYNTPADRFSYNLYHVCTTWSYKDTHTQSIVTSTDSLYFHKNQSKGRLQQKTSTKVIFHAFSIPCWMACDNMTHLTAGPCFHNTTITFQFTCI